MKIFIVSTFLDHLSNISSTRLTCPEPYFVSELLWSPTVEDQGRQDALLEVCTLYPPEEATSLPVIPTSVTSGYLLDIDLDFYSTANPFLSELGAERFDALRRLYEFHTPRTQDVQLLKQAQACRSSQLSDLLSSLLARLSTSDKDESGTVQPDAVDQRPSSSTTQKQAAGGKKQTICGQGAPLITQAERDRLLSLAVAGGDRSATFLHEAGCTCDESPLPHRPSTKGQVLDLLETTRKYLKTTDRTPDLVTIARSSWDGYCPPEDVEFIQEQVLLMLGDLYGDLDVTKDYATPEEDTGNPAPSTE